MTETTVRVAEGPVRVWVQRFLTFQYVCLGWVFFRAQSFPEALLVLRHLVIRGGLESLAMPKSAFWAVLGLVIVGHMLGRIEAMHVAEQKAHPPLPALPFDHRRRGAGG